MRERNSQKVWAESISEEGTAFQKKECKGPKAEVN